MNVGILNEPTAVEVTVGTEGTTADIASGAKLQIVINQWYECPIVIDNMTNLQSQVNLRTKAEQASAYAIAKKMDSTLCDLFDNLGTALGNDGVAITDDVLISAVETLDEADVPEGERVWVFDPSAKADMLKIDKFVRVDYVRTPVVPTGKFGDIYNAPVYITNNLTVNSTGNDGVYMHREALAIIAQEKMKAYIVEQPLKHQATINTEALWGVLEMRDTFGVGICTRKS